MSSDQAAAAPAKKVSKPKVAPAHPKYIEMISAAIRALNERSGSSRQAISKWITANYKISETSASTHIKLALKRGVTSGTLIHTKGLGASGSFKLVKKVEKPKKKKVVKKKPAAKKPAKKTKPKTKKAASPKKAAKKPAAKKDKKPAKKAAKKPTTKKSTPKKTTTKKDKAKKSKAKPAKKVVKPKKTAKK
ncbi:Histone H1.0 [Trichoplax sp. H2]|uniref:H15 domain-containing protein n=1 Tax=Trichoplax adhaerens TaxID=10228 RepID=B3RQA0_TRIAD|nr:hypothetical protein TRIADDRAFT_53828 [Trichoplax adhaerens]EDV28312.1 hypothetical protein TRIADDRAFT_53828 [Trichoplax adhaerens]RDD45661.1 Histone H1.0 [Trichoplax sp. H2]|eukprot:XP_002110146.1 hypothetical protein TRIADDRAFT_53828 [Trichoplax adhaerens]